MRHMALLRLTYISAPQMASFNVEKAWCKERKVTGFLYQTTVEMQKSNFLSCTQLYLQEQYMRSGH